MSYTLFSHPRKIIILGLAGLVYGYVSWLVSTATFDGYASILWGVGFLFVLVILVTLACIELQTISTKWLIRFFLLIMIVHLLLYWGLIGSEGRDSLQVGLMLWSIFLFHFALIILVRYKKYTLDTRRSYTSYIINSAGMRWFSISIAAMTALIIGGSYNQIDLSCEVVLPKVKNMFVTTSGQQMDWDEHMPSILSSLTSPEDGTTGQVFFSKLQSDFIVYQQLISDDILGTKSQVDQEVCAVVTEQIADLSQGAGFRISVVVLIFLLLSPLIALLFNILVGIGTVFLALLIRFHVYTWKERTVPSQELH